MDIPLSRHPRDNTRTAALNETRLALVMVVLRVMRVLRFMRVINAQQYGPIAEHENGSFVSDRYGTKERARSDLLSEGRARNATRARTPSAVGHAIGEVRAARHTCGVPVNGRVSGRDVERSY
jgi:hypothetical protein